MKNFILTILLALITMTGWAKNELKPRLVVCTDIAPADVEPDDMESMVRLMAYAKDVPNLMRRSGQKKFLSLKKENGQQVLGYWPSAEYITSRAVQSVATLHIPADAKDDTIHLICEVHDNGSL